MVNAKTNREKKRYGKRPGKNKTGGEKSQKPMAGKVPEASENKINRNVKDSVFCDLFGKPEYLMQLYQVLHPDDEETTAGDLEVMTLSTTVARNIYNDLGFRAGDRAKAIQKTIRICMDNNILKDYLAGEEAATVMFSFADQVDAMNEALAMERAEAEVRGEERFAILTKILISLERMDDVRRITTDKKYRDDLYAEFNIQ